VRRKYELVTGDDEGKALTRDPCWEGTKGRVGGQTRLGSACESDRLARRNVGRNR
jgi:hypothetical protein